MIQYPTNSTLNHIFSPLNENATKRWKWNGYAWDVYVVPPIVNHDELNNRNLSNQHDTAAIQENQDLTNINVLSSDI